MLHTLKKVVQDRAQYNRVVQGIDLLEKVIVRVPQSMFQSEARDFHQHNIYDFYKSQAFLKEYKIEGSDIVTLNKV